MSALSYETGTMEVKGEEALKESRTLFDLFLVQAVDLMPCSCIQRL